MMAAAPRMRPIVVPAAVVGIAAREVRETLSCFTAGMRQLHKADCNVSAGVTLLGLASNLDVMLMCQWTIAVANGIEP